MASSDVGSIVSTLMSLPEINKIIQIAKSKGFYIKDKKSLESIGLPNEYLFVLKKLS